MHERAGIAAFSTLLLLTACIPPKPEPPPVATTAVKAPYSCYSTPTAAAGQIAVADLKVALRIPAGYIVRHAPAGPTPHSCWILPGGDSTEWSSHLNVSAIDGEYHPEWLDQNNGAVVEKLVAEIEQGEWFGPPRVQRDLWDGPNYPGTSALVEQDGPYGVARHYLAVVGANENRWLVETSNTFNPRGEGHLGWDYTPEALAIARSLTPIQR
ncbi:hypothetical protein [Mycobacteroides saopaulense]|uniref:hypothetical protein n=1 Tax=Mycobacteroides saopaulense TaxID=1578165 RepID=UPI001054C242|nr:hypothetical protein [Mycobacteroides saopaulense]